MHYDDRLRAVPGGSPDVSPYQVLCYQLLIQQGEDCIIFYDPVYIFKQLFGGMYPALHETVENLKAGPFIKQFLYPGTQDFGIFLCVEGKSLISSE